MSGLKQFYTKNIKVFTIILVIIAAFIAYKCYTKYTSAKNIKQRESSDKQSQSQPKTENYRYRSTLSDIVLLQALRGNPNLGGFQGSSLTRFNPSTYGSASKDELSNIILSDIPNFGFSGQMQQTPSEMQDFTKYSAYAPKSTFDIDPETIGNY